MSGATPGVSDGTDAPSSSARGTLVLVATPIGNLADLGPRATRELAAADLIACEDTRRTGRLLAHAGVEAPPLVVMHEHAEARAAQKVAVALGRGARVAVVSDAGMPGISDPGARLVEAALAGGHDVTVVPGPSAAVAALVVSGLPTDRWCVEGFLPRRGSERAARLAALAGEERTTVVFEAPHRVRRTIADMVAAFGPERRLAIVRELTKRFEEVWRGALGDAGAWVEDGHERGELVLVLGGAAPSPPPTQEELRTALACELDAGSSVRDAAAAWRPSWGWGGAGPTRKRCRSRETGPGRIRQIRRISRTSRC